MEQEVSKSLEDGKEHTEGGAEPVVRWVWRTRDPSAAEAGQAGDWSEQGKAKVTEPQGRWGIPQGLQVPAQPRPCWKGVTAFPGHSPDVIDALICWKAKRGVSVPLAAP